MYIAGMIFFKHALENLKITEKCIFKMNSYCQYIHQCTDLLVFCLSSNKVKNNISDNAHRDTLRDAIEEWHCNDTYVSRDSLGHISKVNVCNITKHI